MERTKQLIADMTSRDEQKVKSASCEIIQCVQNRGIIVPLIEYLPKIKNVKLTGGFIAPNQRFVNFAIRIIEFYRDSNNCPCELYKEYDRFDPEIEAGKGNIKIKNILSDNCYPEYLTECLKCGANFKISHREYHYTWWEWENIDV